MLTTDFYHVSLTTKCKTAQGSPSFYYIPGKGVKSFDEIVTVTFIFLSALQQSSSSMHHVIGQETVFKAKIDTKCLDTNILHAKGEGGKQNYFQIFSQA